MWRAQQRKEGHSRAAEKKRSSNTQEKIDPRKVLRQFSKAMGRPGNTHEVTGEVLLTD